MHQRLKKTRERQTRESQAGFRSGRGCTDQISALRSLIEHRYEFRQPTVLAFLDFTAAFDSVHRPSLWCLLERVGVPPRMLAVIRCLYANTLCRVRVQGEDTSSFKVESGVRQGGILSPLLFNVFIDRILQMALDGYPEGISIYPTGDCLTDLTFADDIALLCQSTAGMQLMIDRVSEAAAAFGLVLSAPKSKVVLSCVNKPPRFQHRR